MFWFCEAPNLPTRGKDDPTRTLAPTAPSLRILLNQGEGKGTSRGRKQRVCVLVWGGAVGVANIWFICGCPMKEATHRGLGAGLLLRTTLGRRKDETLGPVPVSEIR